MTRLGLGLRFGLSMALCFAPRFAHAQTDNTLPPLPLAGDGPTTAPQPTAPAPTDSQSSQQPGVEVAPEPTRPPPPTIVVVQQPPPNVYRQQTTDGDDFVSTKHAPKFSLYVGADVGVIGYGGSFFTSANGLPETTGNLVGSGLSFEIDAGARLGRRYLPYVFWEHGFLTPGRRFDGESAHASSDFVGLGFRLISGNPDSVAFLSELAVGFRSVTIANDTETYKMTALEIARLGLGAEIRFSTLFTISPMARISVGSMSDSSGGISYAPNQGDGQTGVSFFGGQVSGSPRDYVVVGLGCGGHFDFFGK